MLMFSTISALCTTSLYAYVISVYPTLLAGYADILCYYLSLWLARINVILCQIFYTFQT
jgi:hypothetical protein